jgi:hypothetical protein
VIGEMRCDVQIGFEKLEVLVEGTEKFTNPSGYSYGLFH